MTLKCDRCWADATCVSPVLVAPPLRCKKCCNHCNPDKPGAVYAIE